jgi:D-glycero-alpha-D-manno-heptose-7-phosphate kinase
LKEGSIVIVVQTPLRLSFAGGGSDFEDYYLKYGGAVLSSAIDKYVFVIVNERFDELVCVNYTRREVVDSPDDIKHGLVREAMKSAGIRSGVEITTLADIPSEGTGLGSSSSITVGLLNALYSHKGESIDSERLAKLACRIEIETLGSPIGKQDQFIAAYGGFRFITFNSHGITTERIEICPPDQKRLCENLLLFYSGITRSSNDILAEQKANIEERKDILAEMVKLAYLAKDAIIAGEFDTFGDAIDRGWALKRCLASKVSNQRIDEILAEARRAGAVGGKVTGAGGGGFILLYCLKDRRDQVRMALRGLKEMPFRFEPDGSKVILNYRRAS